MTSQATELTRRYADLLRAANRSERTIDNYLYSLKGFDRFLGERPLREATPTGPWMEINCSVRIGTAKERPK